MATFPNFEPTYSLTKQSEPRIRTTRFGDGYQQRITFGLNQNPKEWRLTFILRNTDADTVEAFLDARAADTDNFTWTPPGSASPLRWICPSWNREYFSSTHSQLDMTFQQVFEP